MFKFLRRIFLAVTLVSLLGWGWVTWHILNVQYHDVPPISWPPTYDGCLQKWSRAEPDAAKAEQLATRCASYYALIGDRTAPVLSRLQQQVQGRLTESVIEAYLLLGEPPAQGQPVTPSMIISALGTQRIMQLFYASISDAAQPPSIKRRLLARCELEETARAEILLSPESITHLCMRVR